VSYSLTRLWHERKRFLPGIVAVAFSTLLILFEGGLLVGQFSLTSAPIDHTSADVWVGHPKNLSLDLGRPIPERWLNLVAAQPEVERVECFIIRLFMLEPPHGSTGLCTIVGSSLEDGALGAVRELTPELRRLLSQPGAVVADESELGRLGFERIGDVAEILGGSRVRLVGVVHGLQSLAAPYLFCSLETADLLFEDIQVDETTFILARCRSAADAPAVVRRLRRKPYLSVSTSSRLATQTRIHWVMTTKAGLIAVWSAILGLVIGLVITSQTLYAATAAAWREYAVLEALGVPTWRMACGVLAQSFWIGTAGLAVAVPISLALGRLLGFAGTKALFPAWLVGPTAAITMATVLMSGLFALRSLRLVQPAELLR
jgi:putative ABC transport system permease protein